MATAHDSMGHEGGVREIEIWPVYLLGSHEHGAAPPQSHADWAENSWAGRPKRRRNLNKIIGSHAMHYTDGSPRSDVTELTLGRFIFIISDYQS
uniref:Uncharacterized protein n=1 Tax=Oryza glumipatula TaxID=40148 RepID=A0A0D9ZQ05_9ORYZ